MKKTTNKIINASMIIDILKSKGATKPCARCGGKKFSVINGHSNFIVNNEENIMEMKLSGNSLPIIFVVCGRCGAITPHAIYGLLDKESIESEGDESYGKS